MRDYVLLHFVTIKYSKETAIFGWLPAFHWKLETMGMLSLRAVEWVHSVVISRGEVIVNETSPTSARYIGPILHASLHVYCMDHNSIERMRWVPPLGMIDVLLTSPFIKLTNKKIYIWLCNDKLTSREIEPFFLLLIPEDSETDNIF